MKEKRSRETASKSLYHKKRASARKKGKCIQTLPDALEIAELQHATKEYGSLGFRLKVEELLRNVSIEYSSLTKLEGFLHKLRRCLDSLKSKHIGSDFKAAYPFMFFTSSPKFLKKYDHSFKFTPPARCDLVGSYLLKTVTKPNYNIDVAVEMPRDMFNQKDYLNYRYFNKRAAYLAEMFQQLRKLFPYTIEEEQNCYKQVIITSPDQNETMRPYFFIHPLNGNQAHSIIVIQLLMLKNSKKIIHSSCDSYQCSPWIIRLFPVPPQQVFPYKRLAPDVNCVRFCSTSRCPDQLRQVYLGFSEHANTHLAKQLPPTPMYNGALAHDLRMRVWIKRFMTISEKYTAFQSTVQLLKSWAYLNGHNAAWSHFRTTAKHQKTDTINLNNIGSHSTQPSISVSRITGFLLTVICSHVCLTNCEVLVAAAPLQIFRTTLVWIAETDFSNFKVIYGQKGLVPLDESDRQLNNYLMLDCEMNEIHNGGLNILWDSQLFVQELRVLAKYSVAALNTLDDPFPVLFDESILRYSPFLFWDMSLKFPVVTDCELVLPECTVSETDKHELQRSQMINEFKDSMNKQVPLSVRCFLDFHMEHPAHYHWAGLLKRLIARSLGDRLLPECGVYVRFEVTPLAHIKYERDTAENANHPLVVPLLAWTDATPFKVSGTASSLTVAIGVRCACSKGPVNDCSLEVFSTMPWSVVNRGYPVGSLEAQVFSQFWGNSTVRRFKDGAVNQSLIWRPETPVFQYTGHVLSQEVPFHTKHFTPSVVKQILNYILKRYLIDATTLHLSKPLVDSSSDTMILIDPGLQLQHKPILEFFDPVSKKSMPHPSKLFEELKEKIFALQDLPLGIKEISCIDESGLIFFADVPPYIPCCYGRTKCCSATTIAVDCVIEFEKSFGWPSDPKGVFWMKVALLVALRGALIQAYSVNAEIGGIVTLDTYFEKHCEEFTSSPFLDVILDSCKEVVKKTRLPRVLFRIKVFHTPEYLTVASHLTDPSFSVSSLWKSQRFVHHAIRNLRDTWWKARRNAALSTASLEFSCFSSTIRLTKIWAASQLFPLPLIQDMISHLALYIFRHPQCYGPPTTAWTGFLQILRLIAYYDWEHSGMFVDYNPCLVSPLHEDEEALKAARQRCLDIIKNTKSDTNEHQQTDFELQQSSTSGIPTAPQCPFFWISSLDDPHCQFIKLPHQSMAQHLLEIARQTLDFVRDIYSGMIFDKVSAKSANYIQNRKFYCWDTLHLSHLSSLKWKQLFNPRVSQRFDIIVHLRLASLGGMKDDFVKLQEKDDEDAKQASRCGFMNLENSKEAMNLNEEKSFIIPDRTLAKDSQSIWFHINRTLNAALDNTLNNSDSASNLSISSVVERTLRALQLPPNCNYLFSSQLHETANLIRDTFQSYIKSIRSFLGPIADIYYDSLATPYPTTVFLKFNRSFPSLQPLTPFSLGSYPRTLFQDNCDSVKRCSSDLKSALEMPNIPIILATLLCLGCGIVDRVDLL